MPNEAATSLLTLDVERKGDLVLVHCHGKLRGNTKDLLYATVKEQIPGSKRIVLDLTDLSYMDSMGLGTLVGLYVSAKSAGSCLELTNLGKHVRELLGLTHLLAVFTCVGEHGGMTRL